MKNFRFYIMFVLFFTVLSANAFDLRVSPDLYGKQQEQTKDSKGNTIQTTPNYGNYAERNKYVSEKIVAIYDKRSPAYGYRYVLYTPIRNYVGHRKLMQNSMNGGYEPIPDGGEGSSTPCFETIRDAKHYYYPEWY